MKSDIEVNAFQNRIASIIVMHICIMQCKNMLVSTSSFFYNYNDFLNLLALGFIICVYFHFFIIKQSCRYLKIKIVFSCIFILLWWFVSYLFDSKLFTSSEFPYNYVNKQCRTFVAYCLPLFLMTTMLKDAELLWQKFYNARIWVFGVSVISFLLYIVSPSSKLVNDYSMSAGNQMLLCAAILIFAFIRENNYWDFLLFVIEVFCILCSGSRGPLVSILVFVIYAFFKIKRTQLNIIFLVLCSSVVLFVFAYLQETLMMIQNVLASFGIFSRSLNMLISNQIIYDSGRNEYHLALLEALNKSPLFGLGAFGGEKTVGLAHSFYLDVFANFGYLFGGIFLLVLFVKIFKRILIYRNSARTDLIVLFSILLFPRGFFDESFWGTWYLWVIMGLLFSQSGERVENRRLSTGRHRLIIKI